MAYPNYGVSIQLAAAKKCAAAAEAVAEKHGWQLVIAVVDTGGNLVLLHRMENAHLGSIRIAQRKAQTAVSFRQNTKDLETRVAQGGEGLKLLGADNMLAMEGGVLIIKDARIIGAIGVSGAKSFEDGQVANAAAMTV